ncbi:hypothetical protein NDA16_002613 [Ustilago loliicola]|nr:hypothetical protein NDA16_002613 [Ustilago loliicola]
MKYLTLLTALLPLMVSAQPIKNNGDEQLVERATDTTTVHLDQCSGTPQHYASGVLYGVSGTGTPPQTYLQQVGVNYISAGGAQSATSGWGASVDAYKARFQTVVQDAKRVYDLGGVFIIKTSDLWGADATQPSNFPFPGDNGDWTSYDKFIQQLISDIKSSGMAKNYVTQIDVWNEPDGSRFWGRSQDQFLQTYLRGTRALRAAFPQGSGTFLPLVGPSTAGRPDPNNSWFNTFLSTISKNKDATPDIWNWHLEGGGNNDPVPSTNTLKSQLPQYGLSVGLGFQNNEYGTRDQQRPGFGAWHAARYEKVKFNGLRGNWAGGSLLRDNLADLLYKDSNGNYHTTGEFQEWKQYAAMTGAPCTTDAGSSIDSYAVSTPSSKTASALVGNQGFTGTANVVFSNVSSLGSGISSVKAVIKRIPYNNGGEVTGLTTVSTTTIRVSNNQVTVPVSQTDANDAYYVTITAA